MKKIRFALLAIALYFLISIGIIVWDMNNRSQTVMPQSDSKTVQQENAAESVTEAEQIGESDRKD